MSKSQRDKGMRFQRWLANRWNDMGLFNHNSCYSTGAGQARHSGDSDVRVADVANTGPLWVEAKHDERVSPWAALRQAQEDVAHLGNNQMPVAVVKKNRQGVMVCLTLEDFEKLVALRLYGKPLGGTGE